MTRPAYGCAVSKIDLREETKMARSLPKAEEQICSEELIIPGPLFRAVNKI